MAATTSFKLPCPSCDTRILIKDHSMIGRKIDCPRCKYRFVVTEPAPAPEEEALSQDSDDGQSDGDDQAGIKYIPGGPPLEVGAAKPDTKKTRLRDVLKEADKKPAEEEEAPEEDQKKKLFKNRSMTLKVGIVLGVVAVIVLVSGLVVMFSRSGDNGPKSSTPKPAGSVVVGSRGGSPSSRSVSRSASGGSSASSEESEGSLPVVPEERPVVVDASLHPAERELSAWLPNETEVVLASEGFAHNLSDSEPLGTALFHTTGGFMRDSVEKRLGFRLAEIRRIIRAEGGAADHRWALVFLRMDRAIVPSRFLGGLGRNVQPMKAANAHPYYLFQPNLLVDGIGDVLVGKTTGQPSTATLAFYLFGDHKTAIIGDRDRLVRLVEEGRPKLASELAGQGSGSSPAQGSGSGSASASPSVPPLRGSGAGSGPGKAGASTANSSASGSPSPEPFNGPPYGTLTPNLTRVLERMQKEQRKNGSPAPLAVIASAHPNREFLQRIDRILNTDLDSMLIGTDRDQDSIKAMALAVHKLEERAVVWSVGIEFSDADSAQAKLGDLRIVQREMLRRRIKEQLGLDVVDNVPPPEPPKGSASVSGPRGPGKPPPPFIPPPTITATRQGSMVHATVDLSWPAPPPGKTSRPSQALVEFLRAATVHTKCTMEMMDARDPLAELSQAVADYVSAKKKEPRAEDRKFPRGALKRSMKDRDEIPWPVKDRLSFMVEFLPYLPNSDLKQYLETDAGKKLWEARFNLSPSEGELGALGQVLVPQFLVQRATTENSWWIARVGKSPLAATHVVGVGGVGLDIARATDANDPAVAAKVGILGFDRETRFDEIKSGLENTILMIQIPVELPASLRKSDYGPVYPTPWMIGGGNVRGIPETNSLKTFLCTERNGKIGTHVIMADGTVRFLADGVINDDQFKALCSIHADKPANLDAIAPVVFAPVKAEPSKGSGSGSESAK